MIKIDLWPDYSKGYVINYLDKYVDGTPWRKGMNGLKAYTTYLEYQGNIASLIRTLFP